MLFSKRSLPLPDRPRSRGRHRGFKEEVMPGIVSSTYPPTTHSLHFNCSSSGAFPLWLSSRGLRSCSPVCIVRSFYLGCRSSPVDERHRLKHRCSFAARPLANSSSVLCPLSEQRTESATQNFFLLLHFPGFPLITGVHSVEVGRLGIASILGSSERGSLR